MMTDRECFLATTEHRRPDRVLAHAGFTPDLLRRVQEHVGQGVDIGEHYGMHRTVAMTIVKPPDVPELDFSRYWEGADLPEGTTINGAGVAQVPSGFYHFVGYVSPLRNAQSLSEIEQFPMHDLSGWDFSHLRGEAEKGHADGQTVTAWVGHIYESAWQMRGYEQFLLDTIERPAWAECLLERIARQNRIKALAFAQAGADVIHCGDDVANQKALMFSPDTWRRLIHSRWREIWAEVKSVNPRCRIWYHSDGNVSAIVGELIEAGVDILNPLQPECLDVDAIHRRYGRRVTFDGTIGTQSTMPWGSPADVRARVKEVIGKYGRDGGLIVSPTHVLEPEVPLANIDALFAAVREFGTFA